MSESLIANWPTTKVIRRRDSFSVMVAWWKTQPQKLDPVRPQCFTDSRSSNCRDRGGWWTARLVVCDRRDFPIAAAFGTGGREGCALRAFFDGFGVAAPLAYVGFVILEVVIAPIPGTMLYAGRCDFWRLLGRLVVASRQCDWAGIACQLMRVFIGKRAEEYLERSSLARYEEVISAVGLG